MEKNKKLLESKWVDVVIILILMAITVAFRIPSFTLENYDEVLTDSYSDNESVPYFHDMDSYYYSTQVVRTVEENNLLECFNNPSPYSLNIKNTTTGDRYSFLPFLVGLIYKITIKITNVSLNKFIALIGPFLYSLCVIPAYIFVRRRTNRLGGITAGIIAGLNASYLVSTGFSAFDTDILLCFLPLAAITCFLEIIYAESTKKRILYAVLSFISYFLLAITWNSATVYFYLLLGTSGLIVLIKLIKCKFKFKELFKDNLVIFLLICAVMLIALTFIATGKIDISMITNIFTAVKENTYLQEGLYPDPGRFVAELNKLPLLGGGIKNVFNISQYGIINRTGGIAAYLLLIISIGIMIFQFFNKETDDKDKYLLLFLLLWVFAGFISLNMGSRFMKIFILPSLLIIGLSVGQLYGKTDEKHIKLLIATLTLSFIWLPYIGARTISLNQKPSANDALYETTEFIKANTNDNAIIASWWDYGYYYGYNGHRRVLSHGGTYNGRFYYFLSKALVTDNADLAKGIFRMLATSGLDASNLVDEYLNSPKKGCELLKRILPMSKEDAIKELKDVYYFSDEQVDSIINLTHKEMESELIVIISQDMLSKVGAINYYGNYDFTDNFEASNELDKNSMMSKLFYENEVEGFEHLTRITDITSSKGTNVWRAIYK